VEIGLFEEVADALRGLVPPDLGDVRSRAHRYGIKVWFDTDKPTREHYEAQVIGAGYVDDATVLALEVGFHSEHPKLEPNEAVLGALLAARTKWKAVLGKEAVAGPFFGRPDDWRRLSETWPDPDLDDPALAFEIAARLTDYITALEPVRRAAPR
jgi:hypothetical protein